MKCYRSRIGAAFGAELLGSLIFILFGCLGCVEGEKFPNSQFQKGINFGLLIMVCIQLFHAISGSHVNPCITIAAIILQEVKWYIGLIYILGQLIGTSLGYCFVLLLGPEKLVRKTGFCTTKLGPGIQPFPALAIEMLLTYAWTMAMCASWDKRNRHYRDALGMRMGFVVGALVVTGGNFTGASMNPFRSLLPAIFSSAYKNIYVYMLGPLLGAVTAATTWRFCYGIDFKSNDEGGTAEAA